VAVPSDVIVLLILCVLYLIQKYAHIDAFSRKKNVLNAHLVL
jgi:hypothetical protein